MATLNDLQTVDKRNLVQQDKVIAMYHENRELKRQISALKRESAELQRRLRFNTAPARMAERAMNDAIFITRLRKTEQLRPTYEDLAERGVSRRRAEWAFAMLRLADCDDQWRRPKVTDPAEVQQMLNDAYERVLDEGYEPLERYLPRHRRSERR